MTVGIDTTFLIELTVEEHPRHQGARRLLNTLVSDQTDLILADMIIAEYVHVVTDPKRFGKPLEMGTALAQIEEWTSAVEVSVIRGSDAADLVFLQWMRELNLSRKRILDTRLAAQYYCSGATTLLTSNKADFEVYGVFSFMET